MRIGRARQYSEMREVRPIQKRGRGTQSGGAKKRKQNHPYYEKRLEKKGGISSTWELKGIGKHTEFEIGAKRAEAFKTQKG